MAAPAGIRPAVNHFHAASDEERDRVELVTAGVESFERGIGADFRERCNKFYDQFRGFRRFADAWTKSGPNDRDAVLYDAKRHWGAHLHIPLSFRTIETQVPAAIAHRPRMLYLPRQEKYAANVQNVRYLIDAQQDQIDIDLAFQAVMRAGHIYGIGIGKAYWLKQYAVRRRAQRRTFSGRLLHGGVFSPDYQLGRPESVCTHDDPMFEDVDPFDFMWDPFASDMKTATYAIHRTWLSTEGVQQRIDSQAWATPSAQALDEEEIRKRGAGEKYDEIWQHRMNASGFGSFNTTGRDPIHEVWEYHDGTRVLTVLDREVLVQDAESPCVGTMPFQVYRPTPLQKQMVGIGDLEPLEHLQAELDTLRSQRRDAATLALAAGYIFDGAAVDEEDLTFGPMAAIEVRNADPRTAIVPINRQDVPGTAYEEEKVIRADFDAVSGINEALNPGQGTASTATEAQLVQASLSRRIELRSRRFEIEVVRTAAKVFLYLDQRMILRNREIRAPDEGADMQQAMNEGRWRWFEIGPGELQGEFEIIPEGGSMAARNIPQDRQDAQMMLQLAQHPLIEPRRPVLKALELMGVRDGEAWLKAGDAPVPPMALRVLEQAGVDPHLIQRAVMVAQSQDPRLQAQGQQGPDAQQVGQMMGEPPPEQAQGQPAPEQGVPA